jgi:hypothetical protein
MKRVLLTVAVALLIPGVLMAQAEPPYMGLYYDGVHSVTPAGFGPFETFKVYLVLVQWHGYYVKGVEFALYTPDDDTYGTPRRIVIDNAIMPSNFQISTGNSIWTDMAYTYYPPFTGYPDGFDVLATYECWMTHECYTENLWNYRVVVGPNQDSGYLRGTEGPANELFDIRGLTFYLCPEGPIATEEESWGAIKAMYR